jgi:hypothetical protein
VLNNSSTNLGTLANLFTTAVCISLIAESERLST